MEKAFFLDRDGTLNASDNSICKPEEWRWCECAVEAIRWMNQNNFRVIVMSRQNGLSNGRISRQKICRLHNWVEAELSRFNAYVDHWYIAPYHPKLQVIPASVKSVNHKSDRDLFEMADEKYKIDFSNSYMATSKISDLKPAMEYGIQPLYIENGHTANPVKVNGNFKNVPRFETLYDMIFSLM